MGRDARGWLSLGQETVLLRDAETEARGLARMGLLKLNVQLGCG